MAGVAQVVANITKSVIRKGEQGVLGTSFGILTKGTMGGSMVTKVERKIVYFFELDICGLMEMWDIEEVEETILRNKKLILQNYT